MKKTTIALAALAFSGAVLAGGPDPMVAPAPAAQDNMYIGFHFDMQHVFLDGDNQSGSISAMQFAQGGFQAGMLFGAVRAEVSADYSDLFTAGMLSGFLKGAYDLSLGDGVTVYPVAGIGFAHLFADAGNSAETKFSYLLGAGVNLAISGKTSIGAEYNWVKYSDISGSITNRNNRTLNVNNVGKNVFSIRVNRTF